MKKKKVVNEKSLVAVVADIHAGNRKRWGGAVGKDGLNVRAGVILEAFRRALLAALERGCEAFFVAGDLFDSSRPEPAVIAAVQELFDSVSDPSQYGECSIHVVPGNHDLIDADARGGNTACAPLWQSCTVELVPRWVNLRGVSVLVVPYTSTIPMAQHILDVLRNPPSDGPGPGAERVLVTHVGVWDHADAPPWMRRAKDGMSSALLLDAMEAAEISRAFVGNYHEHRVWSRPTPPLGGVSIVQVGTLCPGGFGDAGSASRGLVAFSDGRLVQVPGPRFVQITVDAEQVANDPECSYFIRRIGGGVPVTDLPDNVLAYEVVDEAHCSSFSTSNKEEKEEMSDDPLAVLAAHVEAMPLKPGVERGAVLELVRDAWKKAAP